MLEVTSGCSDTRECVVMRATVEVCDECRRRAIMWRAVRMYLKHRDPDSYEGDVWVCEHLLNTQGDTQP